MTVEICTYTIDHGIVTIYAHDCSEENLQRLERYRDDFIQRELHFVFDTKLPGTQFYFYKWLHRQKATKGSLTYGDALRSIIGTVTTISSKYLEPA